MNRFFPAFCSLVFLVSCSRAGDLPPSQVLHKAAEASQVLESATFTVQTTFSGETELIEGNWNGEAHANGTLSDGGKQLQFALNVDAEKTDSQKNKSTVTLSSDITVAAENEVYVRLNTFTIEPASQLLPPELLAQLLNQWWMIPSGSGAAQDTGELTPDPSLLRMQASVVTVTKDHGITPVGEYEAYEYDVMIDPAKMKQYLEEVSRVSGKEAGADTEFMKDLQAEGKIWIDADTFHIHRISWNISSTNDAKPQEMQLDISISNHNVPVTITPPADAAPFPGTDLSEIPGFQTVSAPASSSSR